MLLQRKGKLTIGNFGFGSEPVSAHLQCVCNQCTCKVSIVRNENCSSLRLQSVSSNCCRQMDRRTNVVAQFLDLLLPLAMKVKKT